ncbi:OmpA family protein [Fibrella forsythiae]|uniref:OmpA family protein n=1 Tax=Fibrella forsythiae TaxID=2817061 RepID=A0ABS3JGB0_9BACT|nr:OmpA family protein [Fibrella forsythiae]MBO0949045.1 OmpA family protein [Fibrella forsythiae]
MLTRFFVIIGVCASFVAQAQAIEYSTPQPRIDDVNDRDVVISRVDLTAQYTIISMRFRGRAREGSEIQFVPTARLYANDGARSFKFIRAENIPVGERKRSVVQGEEVSFVAYFERLDPGIQTFDLFECSDRNRSGIVCFNFWGVHVTNPLKRQQRTPAPQTPAPAPRQFPRTTPPPAKPLPKPAPETAPPVPAPTLAIKGLVRDAKTGKPVVATLTYRLLSGAESYGNAAPDSIRSAPQDGAYQIPGDALTVWDVAVSAKGYFGQRDTISINLTEKTANFDLVPIVAGAKITLNNIYFAQSKYELQAESFPELDQLATVMRQNPTMTIRLEGHTDIIGDFDKNLELSRNRVQSVKQYLTSKGINATRVEAVGYGHSRPINSTPGKPHPENRRVELVITKA